MAPKATWCARRGRKRACRAWWRRRAHRWLLDEGVHAARARGVHLGFVLGPCTIPVSVTCVSWSTPCNWADKGHGFVLLKRKFRIGMEVATQGDPLVVMRGREGLKLLR